MRRGKYNVGPKEARTADGITFHSIREKDAYLAFKILERHKAIAKLELQVPFTLYAAQPNTEGSFNAIPVGKWIADFRVTELDGVIRIYDSKGVVTPVYALKKKLFEACYPQLRIVEI